MFLTDDTKSTDEESVLFVLNEVRPQIAKMNTDERQ
jgi:hypothetical protein